MPGTYIAFRVSQETEKELREYITKNKIPLVYPTKEARRHVTLFQSTSDFVDEYNKKLKEQKNQSLIVSPLSFDVFPSKNGTNRSLVLLLGSYTLHAKHNNIKRMFDVVDLYPEYKPHITMSYDIGDFDIKKLPQFRPAIKLENEYCEPFKEDWV